MSKSPRREAKAGFAQLGSDRCNGALAQHRDSAPAIASARARRRGRAPAIVCRSRCRALHAAGAHHRKEELEVSYLTSAEHRGLGLAVEAVQGILDALWSSGVSRVLAVILPENVASQRVAESAGFSYERDAQY